MISGWTFSWCIVISRFICKMHNTVDTIIWEHWFLWCLEVLCAKHSSSIVVTYYTERLYNNYCFGPALRFVNNFWTLFCHDFITVGSVFIVSTSCRKQSFHSVERVVVIVVKATIRWYEGIIPFEMVFEILFQMFRCETFMIVSCQFEVYWSKRWTCSQKCRLAL